jgi:hypothetical protein
LSNPSAPHRASLTRIQLYLYPNSKLSGCILFQSNPVGKRSTVGMYPLNRFIDLQNAGRGFLRSSPGYTCAARSTGLAQRAVLESSATKRAIREQLGRVLGSPLFKSSKHYSGLLRYVVERALEGPGGRPEERALGIAVFGREPDYDTNLDPVVRTSACEVRKRLAQYDSDPAREAEIRRQAPIFPTSDFPQPAPAVVVGEAAAPETAVTPQAAAWARPWYWIAAAMAGAASLAVTVGGGAESEVRRGALLETGVGVGEPGDYLRSGAVQSGPRTGSREHARPVVPRRATPSRWRV